MKDLDLRKNETSSNNVGSFKVNWLLTLIFSPIIGIVVSQILLGLFPNTPVGIGFGSVIFTIILAVVSAVKHFHPEE